MEELVGKVRKETEEETEEKIEEAWSIVVEIEYIVERKQKGDGEKR